MKSQNLEAVARQRVLKPSTIQIERELEVLTQIMDNQFRIPMLGWRFGLNAIIDLIPEFGDIITTIVAFYILISAVRYRVPKITLLRMGITIAIYFIVGLIPFFGYLFAVWWKPNVRNLKLLRERATVSGEHAKRGRTSDWVFVAVIVGVVATLFVASIVLTITIWWYIATHFQFGM
jgi:hypothetical protein